MSLRTVYTASAEHISWSDCTRLGHIGRCVLASETTNLARMTSWTMEDDIENIAYIPYTEVRKALRKQYG